jgi:membrane protease YdiL (CAAX protease family)
VKIEYSRRKLIKLAFAGEGLALGAALFLSAILHIDLFARPEHILRDLLAGFGAALPPLALFVLSFSRRAGRSVFFSSLTETMRRQVKPIFAEARPFDLVLLSLLAGVSEEMLFRGVIQTGIGLLPASILFGVVHFVTPQYALAAAFMGLYLGSAFSFFQSLLVPVMMHFIYDLGALFYLKYFVAGKEDRDITALRP